MHRTKQLPKLEQTDVGTHASLHQKDHDSPAEAEHGMLGKVLYMHI